MKCGAVGAESRILYLSIRVAKARFHRLDYPRAEICEKQLILNRRNR